MEHIIAKYTKPREYYPPEDQPLELGPTEGCREAIKCLQMHCQLLKGSTSKEVLEVFYQEVGIRLIAYVHYPVVSACHSYAPTQNPAETPQATNHLAERRLPSYRGLERISHVYHVLARP